MATSRIDFGSAKSLRVMSILRRPVRLTVRGRPRGGIRQGQARPGKLMTGVSCAKRFLAANVAAANVMVIRSFAALRKSSRCFWRKKKSKGEQHEQGSSSGWHAQRRLRADLRWQ